MIGEITLQKCIKSGAVIAHLDVTQLVNHHQIDGLFRAVHQKAGKTQAVFAAAAAVAFAGGGDFDAGGRDAHLSAPVCHLFRQNGAGARL